MQYRFKQNYGFDNQMDFQNIIKMEKMQSKNQEYYPD